MLLNFINNILSWIRKDDSFLIVEINDNDFKIIPARANFKDRRIRIAKPLKIKEGATLEERIKKVKHLSQYKIILSLDSPIACTIYSSVSLVREKAELKIDEADLDNIISQAIWRFFDRQRKVVSNKMNVDDIDVVLSDVKIWDIKLDRHRVINPLGFSPREVNVRLSQTLFKRPIFSIVEAIFPSDSLIHMTESHASIGRILGEVIREKSFLVANILPRKTNLILNDGERIATVDSFNWGEEIFLEEVGKRLSVTSDIAKYISHVYNKKQASPLFLKKVGGILEEEYYTLINGLDNVISRLEIQNLYLNAPYELPEFIFHLHFKNKNGKNIKIHPISENFIGENFGFAVGFDSMAKRFELSSVAALILDNYLSPQNTMANNIAKRRARWLMNQNVNK